MQLNLQTQRMGNVAVIRCRGRLATGDEIGALQLEVEKLKQSTQQIVLQLAEVNFVDSGALGALVRIFGVLRNTGGDFRLCEVSPFVLQVLQVTNLDRVFHLYASEREAIGATVARGQDSEEASRASRTRIVCIDTSSDLLAYLRVLLQRSGYDVFTTRHSSDALIFLKATKSSAVICGPGIGSNEPMLNNIRNGAPNVPLLLLPQEFSTAEASQAGIDLVKRVQSLLNAQR